MLQPQSQSFWLKRALLQWVWVAMFAALTACGFHLREPAQVAFKTVQLTGNTRINPPLLKTLKAQGIKLVSSENEAELRLELLKEENEKRILSLSGIGLVREFELYYRVEFRTKLAGENTWSLPLTIESRRDFTYDDINMLSKQIEEKRLLENMQNEVLQGILRRVSALKKTQ